MWGNILTPAYGPGGVLLAEGMAHFSTMLLFEQVMGEAARMEFAKRLEERCNNRRRVDMEQPLARTMMDRPGDFTLAYDKGGRVYWMLLEHLGRERMLEGVQAFIARWQDGADRPLLQDFVESMRPFVLTEVGGTAMKPTEVLQDFVVLTEVGGTAMKPRGAADSAHLARHQQPSHLRRRRGLHRTI